MIYLIFCYFVLLLLITKSIQSSVFYVSNSGDDDNDGTSITHPWSSISKVNAMSYSPGDSILFKRGDTWHDCQVIVSSSGSNVDGYIKYGNYGDDESEIPRLLGSIMEISWVNVGGNIWESGGSEYINPDEMPYRATIYFVEMDDTVNWGKPYKSSTSTCVEEYDWTFDNGHIYIYSPTDPNTRYTGVEITQIREVFFLNDEEYIMIDGLEIAYGNKKCISEGWPETDLDGLIVQNCHIHHVGIKGGVGYGIESWHCNTIIRNNDVHDCGRRSISLNMYGDDVDARNLLIEDNIFYDAFHTTGLDLATQGTSTWTNVTFRRNYIFERINSPVDQIEVFSTAFAYSGVIGGGSISDVFVYDNIFLNISGSAVQTGNVNGPTNYNVFNNVFYGVSPFMNHEYRYFFQFQDGAEMNIKNNIFYNDVDINENPTFTMIVVIADSGQIILDNNLYIYDTLEVNRRFIAWYGTNYYSDFWDEYRTITNQDSNSFIGDDPLFVSSSEYYRLHVGCKTFSIEY